MRQKTCLITKIKLFFNFLYITIIYSPFLHFLILTVLDPLRIDFEQSDVFVIQGITQFECCVKILSGVSSDIISIAINDQEISAKSEFRF